MGMISEFKAFAMRGNVLDMAVGIIIGGAFGTIVKSLVEDVIMPPIGIAMGKVDFSDLKFKIADAVEASEGVEAAEAVYISYGNFINQVITFLIVAFAVFMLVKGMNAAMKKEEEKPAPPKPTKDQELLTEIRDALKKA